MTDQADPAEPMKPRDIALQSLTQCADYRPANDPQRRLKAQNLTQLRSYLAAAEEEPTP